MSAKIKLNAASGGGSFSLQAPSSSANNRVMTLPDTADGTILTTTNPKTGNILQVAQTVKTDTQTQTTAGQFLEITGMTVSITPSSSSNKILVQGKVDIGSASQTDRHGIRIVRTVGGTATPVGLGDADGNRQRFTTGAFGFYNQFLNTIISVPFMFLDSPSTTNAVSYKIEAYHAANANLYINKSDEDQNNGNNGRGISLITAMEVAA